MTLKVNELGVVKLNVGRTRQDVVQQLGAYGVATIHEAQEKSGLLQPYIRPVSPGMRLFGTAVTVLLQPGDNWMLHVAAEQIRAGDVVVAACTSPCEDGFFGELLATSFRAQGAVGLVIDGGVRDVAALREMEFPVFSRAVSAQGTYKAVLGSVNVPVVCAGALVNPGDIVVADDDGVVVVPAEDGERVAAESQLREEKEDEKRRRLANGELNLDLSDMRAKLETAGLKYVD